MDDEIVIGVDLKEKDIDSKKSKKKRNSEKKQRKIQDKKNKEIKKTKEKTSGKNKSRVHKKQAPSINPNVIKVVFILIAIVAFVALIASSSLFNIRNIIVEGNEILSDEKIISFTSIEKDINIFNFNTNKNINSIKENPYIEKVSIERKVPSTVKIIVEERKPKYMLQFADSYVYINNQGYMLEISNEKINVPILVGFVTDLSNIKAGNRIDVADLEKMDMVIKIYEAAKSNDLGDKITKIDISNEKNYTLFLEGDQKTVYLGDGQDLNTRILYLKAILDAATGRAGEIFLNVDLNSEKVYFRPSSN